MGRLLLAAGGLDPTFGAGGLVTTAFYTTGKKPTQVNANAAAVQMQMIGGQEKIIVAGRGPAGTGEGQFALARYNPDGSLDTELRHRRQSLNEFQRGSD